MNQQFGITARGAVAALMLATTLGACATHEKIVVRETVVERPAQVRHMPPPIREDRGNAPAPGWNWVPGHWKWEGSDWAWVHGKWVQQAVPPAPAIIIEQITVAPSPHHYWVPGHWIWRFDGNGGWVWVHGAWHS